jgi:hypothetical protein
MGQFEADIISKSFVTTQSVCRTQSHRVVRGMICVFAIRDKTVCECHNHREVGNY